jgi:hydrogenase-4 component B
VDLELISGGIDPMQLSLILWCIAALLGSGVLAVSLANRKFHISRIVYGFSLVVSCIALVTSGMALLTHSGQAESLTLPLGLPWLGTHFRLDALSSFFVFIVNLGAAGASLYALGYAQHEPSPNRVLPFYPLFLAGMNLVLLADDAFTFLLSWEFMSLSSWALVMAHHKDRENVRAGYIYLVMASFGTLSLLLAFGLLAGPEGAYDFAAPGSSGRSEPCFSIDERRDDQGCGVRLHPHHF